MSESPNLSDSPRVTEQAALTTSTGRIWLIIAGILSVLCIGFLWPMTQLTRVCPVIEPAPRTAPATRCRRFRSWGSRSPW